MDHLQDKIDALETRGKGEEVALLNVQAVISSYAIEIAMKSLWALDHPDKSILRTHDLVEIFDDLKEETVKSLERLQWTRQELEEPREPFISNRYSMEGIKERMLSTRPGALPRLGRRNAGRGKRSIEKMLQPYEDWRFAQLWGLMGMIIPVVLHLLPEPFHIPLNWGFPVGWVTLALIMGILARFRNRS